MVNGRPLKSFNQFYNKIKAFLQSQLQGKQQTSKRIQKLTAKRNNRVDSYLHQASRWIIDYLDSLGIGKLIIGKNTLGQQEINNGKRNNQSFVYIPHANFAKMLIYKGFMKGIKVILTEESYTSRASFLTLDTIPTYERERGSEFKSISNRAVGDDCADKIIFSGYRETRGIYKITGENTRINADVNGSYNIMRKAMKCGLGGFSPFPHSRASEDKPHEQLHQDVIPTVFDGGIGEDAISEVSSEIKAVRGVVVRPIRVTPGRAKSGQCYI